MGKVCCVRDFKCEVCGIPGMLQILSNTYARVRHYKHLKNGKPQFEYHKQNIKYVNKLLNTTRYDHSGQNNIDLNLNEKDLKSKNNLSLLTCPGSIVRSSIGGCRPPDPGSNPGQGATSLIYSYLIRYNGLLASILLSSLETFLNGSAIFLDPVVFLGSLFKVTPASKSLILNICFKKPKSIL